MQSNLRITLLSIGLAVLLASCGLGATSETTTTTTSSTTTTTTIPAVLSLFSSNVPGLSVGDCFNEGSGGLR